MEEFTLTFHTWFVMGVVVFAIIAYASERVALEITSVAILSSILLVFFYLFPLVNETGERILTTQTLFMGFSNPALISVLCLIILGQAIVQTGALNELVNLILHLGRNWPVLSMTVTLILVMVVSGLLNNTPVVVIFIPIMAALAKGMNISVSKVMIPLSFVSILGGMTTLVGSSTNLLVSGKLEEMGLQPLSFFEFTVPGAVLAFVGFIYVLLVVPKLLPDRASLVRSLAEDDDRQFVAQIEVDFDSDFVGKKLESGTIPDFKDVNIRMIQRGEHAFLPPFDNEMVIKARDIIIVSATRKELAELLAKRPNSLIKDYNRFIEEQREEEEIDTKREIHMAEVVVAPNSRVIGQNLEQIGFRREYNALVLGIQRQSRLIRARVTEIHLAPGDVLLVMGTREAIFSLHNSKDLLLMEWSAEEIHSGSRAIPSLLIFGAVVGAAALNILPISIAAFTGLGAILLFKCLNIRQAIRAFDFKIVTLVGSSIALGTALQATGGASYIAHLLIVSMQGASPYMVMGALFILMAVLTNILSNNASAVLFTPIALNLAVQMDVDPRMFIYAVIFACNCSFATPIGYKTNLLVMGPGHHAFSDFMRVGIPLVILMWGTYALFASWYFG